MSFPKAFRWLFQPPREPVTAWAVIKWWEVRRIPYNLIVFGIGFVAFIIFLISIFSAGVLKPGEDAVEPMLLFFAPFLINFCYTLGWLVDAPLRLLGLKGRPRFTSRLFIAGLAFSLFMVTLPAILWGGYRLLQLTGLK